MKNKKVLILLAIGVLLLISGGIMMVVTSYKNDKAAITKTMNDIVKDYESFKKKVENFSDLRENIYNEVMSAQYYTDIYSNYSENIKKIEQYENAVVEIDDISKNLKNNCLGKNYNDQTVMNKCNAFVINYEQSINYFINDINRFNDRIKEYNDWVATQTDTKYKKITEYSSKYKEYIDINNDKTFSGKAEN